jgi:DNA-3-methyladenine glycosylase
MGRLGRKFYEQPAIKIAKQFLGKFLVYNSPKGKVSGQISEVEIYSAPSGDDAAHGFKRTKRTGVLFGEGGHLYVYLIYGMHIVLGVVVNKKSIPEVIFIRAVIPAEGLEIMKRNFGRKIRSARELASGPGKLCKSFGITKKLYGADLAGDLIYIEDRGIRTNFKDIIAAPRIGLNPKFKSSLKKWRFYIK